MNSLNEYTKNLRHDFLKASFNEKDANNDPFKQFEKWYAEIVRAEAHEPNAMVLSTATKKGKPTSRIVLLRGFEKHHFTFFTNYLSKKGAEILDNPHVSLLFYWPELERQVRIEGKIVKASAKISDNYFNTRPAASRIGAWASPQSKTIKGREELEALVKQYESKFSTDIPRPKNWGGYVVKAAYYEFWQGRESRLHDRICYTLKAGKWKKERLAP